MAKSGLRTSEQQTPAVKVSPSDCALAFQLQPCLSACWKAVVKHTVERPTTRDCQTVLSRSRRAVLLQIFSVGISVPMAMAQGFDSQDDDASSMSKDIWPPAALRRAFAYGMETGMDSYEVAISDRKRRLFSMLPPNKLVLDLGIGTGPNLAYLPDSTRCVGLDKNEFMGPYAAKKASALVTRNIKLEMKRGTAEEIPASDEVFDAVICTLTLCSVRNPAKVIEEVQRVLKPGGLFLFIEHVRSESRTVRAIQNVLTPVQKLLADGCHLNRNTGVLIRKYGHDFSLIDFETFQLDLGYGGAIISTQLAGYAVKKTLGSREDLVNTT